MNKVREALAEIFELIEDGTLVRDVSRDHESDWSIRALKLTMTLKKAQAALAETEQGQRETKEEIIAKLRLRWCGEVSSTRVSAWKEAIDYLLTQSAPSGTEQGNAEGLPTPPQPEQSPDLSSVVQFKKPIIGSDGVGQTGWSIEHHQTAPANFTRDCPDCEEEIAVPSVAPAQVMERVKEFMGDGGPYDAAPSTEAATNLLAALVTRERDAARLAFGEVVAQTIERCSGNSRVELAAKIRALAAEKEQL